MPNRRSRWVRRGRWVRAAERGAVGGLIVKREAEIVCAIGSGALTHQETLVSECGALGRRRSRSSHKESGNNDDNAFHRFILRPYRLSFVMFVAETAKRQRSFRGLRAG